MKKKKKKTSVVYEQVDKENADVDISKKDITILVDISPDFTVPEDERIMITRFDGDPNIVPDSDSIFLMHESNDDLDIDSVKFHIATNRDKSKVNIKELEKLSKDKDKNIRAAIGRNAFIGGDILHTLAQSKSKYIRESVASNSYGNLQDRTIKLLMVDKDMYVRNALSSNPSLTPVLINEFLLTEEKDILVMCNLMYQVNKYSRK